MSPRTPDSRAFSPLINTLLQQGEAVAERKRNRFQQFLSPICNRPLAIGYRLLLALFLLASLSSGCSKNSSASSTAAPKSVNLGALELTYDVANRQDLGGGAMCVLTARPLDRQSFELLADLEKSGKKIASTRVIPARIGAPLEISFGDVRVQFTPQIKP